MIVWHFLSNRWNSAITEYALNSFSALKLSSQHEQFLFIEQETLAFKRAQKDNLHPIGASFSLLKMLFFFKAKRKISPQVIFVYGGPETLIAIVLALLSRHKIKLVKFYGYDLQASKFKFLAVKLYDYFIDLYITPNQNIKHSLETMGVNGNKVHRILLPIDEHKFFWTSATINVPELVILGRLDPIKGHAIAIKIFSALREYWGQNSKLPLPRLKIIGENSLLHREDIESYVLLNQLKLNTDVFLINERLMSLPEVMCNSTVGWICSQGSEEICRVAEEFLLCGTAVLVNLVGGLPEILFDNAGIGVLHAEENIPALIREIFVFVEKSYSEAELVRQQRASRAQELFSFRCYVNALLSLIEPKGEK